LLADAAHFVPQPSNRDWRAQWHQYTPCIQKDRVMSLIKPRTRGKQLVRHRTRLDRETNETLYAYAHFIGEPTEYVLNQVIDTVLANCSSFWITVDYKRRQGWKAHRPQVTVSTRFRIGGAARS
jgi:hypothetical protein